MRIRRSFAVSIVALAIAALCACAADDFRPESIIALERTALDRWGKGDPHGYLEAYAPDVTYFDPMRESRADGIAAMKEYLTPLTGKIRIDRYEVLNPKVQRYGDTAILSYNLISYGKRPTGESIIVRWNSTVVYARLAGQWKIVHSHWAFTKPEMK